MAAIVHSGFSHFSPGFGTESLFERGLGGVVVDAEGRNYIDFVLGYGSVILGHNSRGFRTSVDRYSQNGLLLPGYSPWHVALLRRLLKARSDNYFAAFFKTGSESITAAIRVSSRLSSKKGILRCGFLGWHDAQLSTSVRWHEPLQSPFRWKPRFIDGFRGVAGDEEVFNWVSLDPADLTSIVSANAHRIGCFLLDTYQLRFAGIDAIRSAISTCRSAGIYVVADETKIAGRVSPLGFAADFDWDVDFVIIGKALANGAPLSILLGSQHHLAAAEESRIWGTFSQELGGVFGALATLDEMERRDIYGVVRSLGCRIANTFNVASEQIGLQHLVQAEAIFGGSMFEIMFSAAILGDWNCRQRLCSSLQNHGILLLHGHPSYVCEDHRMLDFDDLEHRFGQGLAEWKAAIDRGEFQCIHNTLTREVTE
jgi:glutamate-1-semialdehyde 2,1-aminomutase